MGTLLPGELRAGKERPLLTTRSAGGKSLALGKEVPEVPSKPWLRWGAKGVLACERGSCSATS